MNFWLIIYFNHFPFGLGKLLNNKKQLKCIFMLCHQHLRGKGLTYTTYNVVVLDKLELILVHSMMNVIELIIE